MATIISKQYSQIISEIQSCMHLKLFLNEICLGVKSQKKKIERIKYYWTLNAYIQILKLFLNGICLGVKSQKNQIEKTKYYCTLNAYILILERKNDYFKLWITSHFVAALPQFVLCVWFDFMSFVLTNEIVLLYL